MSSSDLWEPKLRVKASNLGGSGYRIPTRLGEDGKPILVPGITTVNNAINMPGLVQWAVDQTAAYAVANVDGLLSRTEEQGWGFLRFLHRRKPDVDSPELNLWNYHDGVLNDLAELGSKTHDWINDFVTGGFPEDPDSEHQQQMIEKFLEWWSENDVEVLETEVTVVGDGYAGTLDHIWRVNGTLCWVDAKTSRKIRETHIAQLAAIGAADGMMMEVPEGHEGSVEYDSKRWGKTHWIEVAPPACAQYAVLHLRPDTEDGPAFCEFQVIPHEAIDQGFEMFRGALRIKHAQRAMKLGGWLE